MNPYAPPQVECCAEQATKEESFAEIVFGTIVALMASLIFGASSYVAFYIYIYVNVDLSKADELILPLAGVFYLFFCIAFALGAIKIFMEKIL